MLKEVCKVTKGARMQRRPAKLTILNAFVELLQETDFDKITVRTLCQRADIARSTFYMHFSDIYEVIQTLEDGLIAAFKKVDAEAARQHRTPGGKRTDWGLTLDPPYPFYEWFEVCLDNWDALRAMLGPHGDRYFVAKFRRVLTDHVNFMMDADEMPRDELRRGFNEAMVECHFILLSNWLLHENTSLTAQNIAIILNSMRIGGNTLGHYAGGEDGMPPHSERWLE